MARRNPGEGSICRRKDGRWQVSLQVNGIRKTAYAKTEREARQRLLSLQKQVALQNGLADPGTRTVNDLLDAWLKVASPNWRGTTLEEYDTACRCHIRPDLGQVRLSRLTPMHVQEACARLQKRGTHRAALRVYTVLHQACRFAVLWGWLGANPCDRVPRPRYRPPRKPMWTPDQVSAFLKATETDRFGPLWAFLIASGCRLGEALGLAWAAVRWDTDAVDIRANLQRVGREWRLYPPKTAAGERTVALPPWAMAALRRQRTQQAEWRLRAGPAWADTLGLVFTQDNGAPLHGPDVSRALRLTCKALGLPLLSPHGLRHLHASLLLDAGVGVPQVSARLGHASAAITMAVYAHALGDGQDDAVRAIASVK